jgi:DNA-directed RNA polymerase beta subunit
LEDFIKENIERDAGRIQQKAAYKMQLKKNLSWLTPGFFSPQIRSTIIGNELAQNVEGVNPLEHLDNSHKTTKLGQGGIPSDNAIPDSSRNITPTSFGFLDPLHVVENTRIGVNNYVNQNVVKGKDNKLYRVIKTKHGLKWMSHPEIVDSQVLVPEF